MSTNFNPIDPSVARPRVAEAKSGGANLDIGNPEQLIYENGIVAITVLGGIKLEGLDRMRVTLKIDLKDTSVPAIRHNLDLYNDTQLEKLIRKTADRLEIGTSVIAASLSELTENLENYRLERLAQTETLKVKRKELTETEKQSATDLLKSPNLLEKTNELVGKSGIIGEVDNRLLMYLIFTSRKRDQPLHIISLGSSGTGKTHLQESVANLIPEEDKIEITTLSENAFYYFGQQELKHKLILIEDLDGAENALYPLRELQSKKRISKTVAHKNTKGETRSINLVVEGPVSVAGCTTKESIYEDNSNRSFLIYLDESAAQDQKIMDYQRRASAGKLDRTNEYHVQELLKNSQRLLQPITVVNPYAELLHIPQEVFKPRRTNAHYLQFIEAVTFYHQKQREQKVDSQTGAVYIETTLEDIENANRLLKTILIRKSDDLTGACRNHFEKLKLYLLGSKVKQFTNSDISRLFRISLTTIKRYHLDLVNNGYLKAEKPKGSKAYNYEIVSYEEYEQLKKRIDTVLDEALQQLKDKLKHSKSTQVKKPVPSVVKGKSSPSGSDSPKQPSKVSEPIKSLNDSNKTVKVQ